MAKIDEFKNRMTAPIGAVPIDPKTGKRLPKPNADKKDGKNKRK